MANLETSDWARVAELVERYGDLPFGMVDASVVAIAERAHADTVVILDRKHLPVVQPRHVPAFSLLPDG